MSSPAASSIRKILHAARKRRDHNRRPYVIDNLLFELVGDGKINSLPPKPPKEPVSDSRHYGAFLLLKDGPRTVSKEFTLNAHGYLSRNCGLCLISEPIGTDETIRYRLIHPWLDEEAKEALRPILKRQGLLAA